MTSLLQQIYFSGRANASKRGSDVNEYSKVVDGVSEVLKSKGVDVSGDDLAHWFHNPLVMMSHNETIEQIIDAMDATFKDHLKRTKADHEHADLTTSQQTSSLTYPLSNALRHDPAQDVDGLISDYLKKKYPTIRRNTKQWTEEYENMKEKALKLAKENKAASITEKLTPLKKYWDSLQSKKAGGEDEMLLFDTKVIKTLKRDSSAIPEAEQRISEMLKRKKTHEDYISKTISEAEMELTKLATGQDIKKDLVAGKTVVVQEAVVESTPSTDWNYALKAQLKAEQEVRKRAYATVEEFRKAKTKEADLLSTDFHLKSHKNKAEQYKPGTIQYNKHMAKYNERLKEIADLRREAEEGKTLHELRIEETMRENDQQRTESEAGRDAETKREERMKNTNTEYLKNIAFAANISWTNDKLSWKERHAAKYEGRAAMDVLTSRGIDISKELLAKKQPDIKEIKKEIASGATVTIPEAQVNAVIESEPSEDVKMWFNIAHGIVDYKGGRNDRRSILMMLINSHPYGRVKSRNDMAKMAISLGKDLGYGEPAPTSGSWERYFAVNIANETGKDVHIINYTDVVHPEDKSTDKRTPLQKQIDAEKIHPVGVSSYEQATVEQVNNKIAERVVQEAQTDSLIKTISDDVVLKDMLKTIKMAQTVTVQSSIGEKVTYPKRADAIRYAAATYTYLLKGGVEPTKPISINFEEEKQVYNKAVAAAKKTRSLQTKEINVIKSEAMKKGAPFESVAPIIKSIQAGKTVVIPETIIESGQIFRYASFNRPLWIGFDPGVPYTRVDIQKSDYINDRKPHDVIETKQAITPDHLRNLELTDYQEVAEKGKLYAYAKTVFPAGSHLNSINDLIKSKKIINTEKIDEYKSKLDKQKLNAGKTIIVPEAVVEEKQEKFVNASTIIKEVKKEIANGKTVIVPDAQLKPDPNIRKENDKIEASRIKKRDEILAQERIDAKLLNDELDKLPAHLKRFVDTEITGTLHMDKDDKKYHDRYTIALGKLRRIVLEQGKTVVVPEAQVKAQEFHYPPLTTEIKGILDEAMKIGLIKPDQYNKQVYTIQSARDPEDIVNKIRRDIIQHKKPKLTVNTSSKDYKDGYSFGIQGKIAPAVPAWSDQGQADFAAGYKAGQQIALTKGKTVTVAMKSVYNIPKPLSKEAMLKGKPYPIIPKAPLLLTAPAVPTSPAYVKKIQQNKTVEVPESAMAEIERLYKQKGDSDAPPYFRVNDLSDLAKGKTIVVPEANLKPVKKPTAKAKEKAKCIPPVKVRAYDRACPKKK